jgi:hypothetical protein
LSLLIDDKDIPQSYGGQLPWKFEDDPDLDDTIRGVIGEMPKGPAVFVDGASKSVSGRRHENISIN